LQAASRRNRANPVFADLSARIVFPANRKLEKELPYMAKQARAARTDRRARILDAATEAFLECGFEVASTAEIARRAKVSKRELYAHFRDKRDILAAVITELQADIQSKANVSWSSSGDVREVLRQAGTDLLRFINSERFGKLFRIVAAESFHDPVSSRKFYLLGPAMGRKNTAAFLKRHMAQGNLLAADPLQAADDFLDMLVSSRYLTAVVLGQMRSFPKAQVHVEHAVDMFLTYYGARRTSRTKRDRGAKTGNGVRPSGR
jgi:TetR/AcrR family transcriptional repressor of mexJK operon